MKKRELVPLALAVFLALGAAGDGSASQATAAKAASQVAAMYAADFVSPAATGYALNDAGDVVGRAYTDPGCGPFCLPPQEIVVWRGGNRIALPLVPGYVSGYQFPYYLNNQGLIAGVVGIPGSTTHAAVWVPSGAGYAAQDLGALPGMSSADVAGLDDQGRMVGWSTLGGMIPSAAAPFLWSQATGMVNLATQGYPNERPAAISRGGKVVTWGSWYQLGFPASALRLPALPAGFLGAGVNGSAINDNGDQAHFLVSVSGQNLVYPFRLSNGGTWQMLTGVGTGQMTRSGMGSINEAQDVTLTVTSTGAIAAGPAGLAGSLASLLSPAYGGAFVSAAGPMNASGQILAQVYIGQSPRLMKLTPVTACGSDCLVSSSLRLTAQFVQDPRNPGSCFQGGSMYNTAAAAVTITSETGVPVANALVSGRFLDSYWTNRPVTGTTNASGVVNFAHTGPCGVGSIAFLVENASLGTRQFDRTRGTVAASVIPGVAPPANQAPVANASVSCNGLACTFDAAGSTDDVGITAYAWRDAGGNLLSNQARWSRTYASSGRYTVVLTVYDAGGLSGAKSVTFDVTAAPPPPANLAPIASAVVDCPGQRTCTFDATGSRDPDGTIVAYRWISSGGSTLSRQAVFSERFSRTGRNSVTLQVTDNGGLTASRTVGFTVVR